MTVCLFSGQAEGAVTDNMVPMVFPAVSEGVFRFYVDAVQYTGKKGNTRLELVYAFDIKQFRADSSLQDTIHVKISLLNNDMQTAAEAFDIHPVRISTADEMTSDGILINRKILALWPGEYTLKCMMQKGRQGAYGIVQAPIRIRHFGEAFSLSGVALISHIQKAEDEGSLVRQGLTMLPSITRQFSTDSQPGRFFAYYEINQLMPGLEGEARYDLRYRVTDKEDAVRLTGEKRNLRTSSTNTSRVEIIQTDQLSPGAYHLILEVTDLVAGRKAETRREFHMVSTESVPVSQLPMTEADQIKYFDQIMYIATEQEKAMFHELDNRGKQAFLIDFWERRDPDPDTPENEFMLAHFRRLEIAQSRFTGGVRSDMGRIFIQYGPPMDIERDYSGANRSMAVEIWTYGVDGRSEFVFVDRSRDGHYLLMHSTHRDEYQNPDWKNQLQ